MKILIPLALVACSNLLSGAVIGLGQGAPYASGYTNFRPTILAAGNTIVDVNTNTDISGIDALYLDRSTTYDPAKIQAYLNSGGRVVTEFTATNAWFDGTLASFSGTLLNSFYVPSGSVGGGNTVKVLNPAHPLAENLPASWVSRDSIGVLQAYSGLDPAIVTPIVIEGTGLGTLPVVGQIAYGQGSIVMFFSDFGDFSDPPFDPTQEEKQLLLNSLFGGKFVDPTNPVPEPSTFALAGIALAGLAFLRRR